MANILRQGIAAYQKTMKPQPETPEPENLPKPAKKIPQIPGAMLRVPRPGSVLPQKDEGSPDGESKCRRVAKLLILIGADRAAGILAELDPDQVEEISREIASIRGIGAEEGGQILAEFRSLFAAPVLFTGASSGGVEAARRILYAAYGPEKGEALLNRSIPASKENAFGFLKEFAPGQIVFLLKDESPQTAALVLSRLPAGISAQAIGALNAARKAEIMRRMAHQREVAPEVLERVALAIKEKARHIGGADAKDIEIDGMQTLAAILKQGDYDFGDRIISELETDSPDIGRDLKDRLYTLDDVTGMVDRQLAEKLKTMSDRDIAVLLKGRAEELSDKILSNVSAGRRAQIREESEILGAVPKRECDAAAREFLAWFRLARENGEIILTSDEDVFV